MGLYYRDRGHLTEVKNAGPKLAAITDGTSLSEKQQRQPAWYTEAAKFVRAIAIVVVDTTPIFTQTKSKLLIVLVQRVFEAILAGLFNALPAKANTRREFSMYRCTQG